MNAIEKEVMKILEKIKRGGDKAVCYYTKKFDGIALKPSQFRIPSDRLRRAFYSLPDSLRKALKHAERNISSFYRKEKKMAVKNWLMKSSDKKRGQWWIPIDTVGMYVPGGKFSYPSTVLMAAVPARIAGVRKIIMISPPKKFTDEVLASAWIAGVNDVYQVGGPAGVAALAYGTKKIPKVDKIIGPGNIYVTAAKKLLYGEVGIDMLAGPSEVVIVADNPRDADWIIQDLKAQKEHDRNAQALLVSLSRKLSQNVRKTYPSSCIKDVNTVRQAADAVNRIAPEHVELMTRKNIQIMQYIRSAGTVCIGPISPVALGDYIAGPSHILPTAGTARFSSGLSVIDFYKRINIIHYTRVSSDFTDGIRIAEAEGMKEHKASLQRRVKT